MPKKHNKKRNTAILFELLCKEITKSLHEDKKKRAKKAKDILKNYFSEGDLLREELNIYRDLYEAHDMPKDVAKKTLEEVKRTYVGLNKGDIQKQQSQVIDRINQDLDDEKTWNRFIPNYKSLATIDQLFKNDDLRPREKVLFEEKILKEMQSPEKKEEEKKVHSDTLLFEKYVEKFHEKYKDQMTKEQRELLAKYTVSEFEDQDVDFKLHLKEEIERLNEEISSIINTSEQAYEDEELREKLSTVKSIIKEFSGNLSNLSEKDIRDIMRAQKVVSEIREDES